MPLTACMLLLSISMAFAQPAIFGEKPDYVQVIANRTSKIVTALNSSDTVLKNKVQAILVDQYYHLSYMHNTYDAQVKYIQAQKKQLTAEDKTAIEKLGTELDNDLMQLHTSFLAKLNGLCKPVQEEVIKNGKTYGVLPVMLSTYKQMLPQLSGVQKKQIQDWLAEAREHAMDAESSDKKREWFGKYKERVNKYLSDAGIDMKKAEADWQAHIN